MNKITEFFNIKIPKTNILIIYKYELSFYCKICIRCYNFDIKDIDYNATTPNIIDKFFFQKN